jgi:ATP-binding cassette subfamily C protein
VIGWLPARERWQWFVLVPIAGLAALIEAAGALAVFGLLRLVVDPELVRTTPVVSRIFELWPGDNARAVVALLALGVGAIYLLRAVFLSWAEWLRQGTVYRSSAVAADRLLQRYLAADYLFHARRRSASLIEPMTRASDIAFELGAGSAVNILAEAIVIVALAIVLLVSAPPITLVTVAIVMALVLVPIILTRRAWETIGESERRLYQEQQHLLQQSLGAIKDVKVTGRQPFFEERFRHLKRELGSTKQRRAWSASLARLGVEATLIFAMLLVIFLVMRQDVSGGNTVSVLALFAYTGFRVVPSANRIMMNVGYMREAHSWIRNMDEDMRRLKPASSRPYEHDRPMLQSTLACEDVSFGYEGGPPLALSRITFTISRGQSIGIVGPTGAGKSTLVDVLLGLLPPTTGEVLIDGEPLEGRERAWQRQVGYVSQSVYLLDDTLRRNVAFGMTDGAIDEARLAAAVAQARLDDVVVALPLGLDTIVGENGVRLSGGQRQRVAIARALYHDPPVLFFDEATAALDNQTEREVTEAIAHLRQGFHLRQGSGGQDGGQAGTHGSRTVIAIAHRLSTVKDCDRLIYLKDGKLAGFGTYQELMTDPEFRAIS